MQAVQAANGEYNDIVEIKIIQVKDLGATRQIPTHCELGHFVRNFGLGADTANRNVLAHVESWATSSRQ